MSLDQILRPSSGCHLGVYPSSSCDSAASDLTRVHNHETLVNRTLATNGLVNVVSAYHDFDDFTSSFGAPSSGEGTMSSEGRLLLIHWTPRIFGGTAQFKWADIAAGTYDAQYVDPTARAMRDFGKKFFLVFHNEMNASSTAQGGTSGTDAEYAAAAQHIHDRFIAQGATNVVWVFKPSGYQTTISRMNTLYPGDAYVDWIMWDPYAKNGEDFDYVMNTKYPMYNWATVTKSGSHTKPLGFGEWGATEASGPTTKAQFFAQVQTELATNWPLVKLITYFNSTNNAQCLNTSAAALSAYRALAADAYFRPNMGSTPPPPPGIIAFRAGTGFAIDNTKSKQVTVPLPVQADDGMLLIHNVTRSELRQAAEGANGTNVTVANSGASGSNPMSTVTAAPAPTYDTGTKHGGTSSWKAALVAQTSCSGFWDDVAFGSPSTYWNELFINIPSAPTAAARLYQQESAAGTFQWGIAIDTDGKLKVRDNTGTNRGSTAAALTTGVQHRIECQVDWNGSTTTVQVRRYSGADLDTNTITEAFTATAFAQAAAPGKYHAGARASSAITWAPHVDGFRLSKSGWIGPEGTSPVLDDAALLANGWVFVDSRQVVVESIELVSRLYRKTAKDGDPGSTLTLATDRLAHGSALILAYSGVDTLTVVDVVSGAGRASDSTTSTTPTESTNLNNDWIINVWVDRANPGAPATAAWTLPGGQIQRAASFGTGTDGRVSAIASDDGVGHASPGPYGGATATADRTSFAGITWVIALAPAGTGGGETQSCGMVGIPD